MIHNFEKLLNEYKDDNLFTEKLNTIINICQNKINSDHNTLEIKRKLMKYILEEKLSSEIEDELSIIVSKIHYKQGDYNKSEYYNNIQFYKTYSIYTHNRIFHFSEYLIGHTNNEKIDIKLDKFLLYTNNTIIIDEIEFNKFCDTLNLTKITLFRTCNMLLLLFNTHISTDIICNSYYKNIILHNISKKVKYNENLNKICCNFFEKFNCVVHAKEYNYDTYHNKYEYYFLKKHDGIHYLVRYKNNVIYIEKDILVHNINDKVEREIMNIYDIHNHIIYKDNFILLCYYANLSNFIIDDVINVLKLLFI